MRGLKFKDIDFDNNYIIVRNQLYRGTYRSTKNNKERYVMLPKIIKDYLAKYREDYKKTVFSDKQILEMYCFVNELGNPYSMTTLERHYKSYIEKAKVKSLNLHGLRHSYCTNLISEAGYNHQFVAEQVGDTIETIMGHYVGTSKTDKEKALNLLDNLIN